MKVASRSNHRAGWHQPDAIWKPLHAYLEWGEHCVEHLNGMFAFAVFDGRSARLLLMRDRLGVKPLFYAPLDSGMLFASELKAILAHPQFKRSLDVVGLVDDLSLSKATTQTLFQGIRELAPGHRLQLMAGRSPVLERYWSLERREHTDSLAQTVEKTRALLEKALGEQLYPHRTSHQL